MVSPYSPSGLGTVSRERLLFFFSLLKLPKPLLTSLHFSSLCLLRLGSLLGSILAPSWAPSWLKFGPSRLSNLHFLQKVDFQKNERHRGREHDFDPKTAPKTTQDRPKTAPRRSSRSSFFDLVFIFDFGPSWVRFWLHFGSILAPFWVSKSAQVPRISPSC